MAGSGALGGLLLALLVTSVKAIESFTQGSIATRYINLGGPNGSSSEDNALAIAGLVLSGLAALTLFAAWYQFVRATTALLVAYGDSGRDDEMPSPSEWLATNENRTARTMLSDVLQYVGAAWVVIIVTPAVLTATEVFQ